MARMVVLVVLDGWGIAAKNPGNAIEIANTLNMDRFWVSFPHTTLFASGESVGLPHNEPGNTEVGHLNLGAGRIVYQDLTRINNSIADGSFFKNPAFLGALKHAIDNNSNIHLMGLLGSGGVHSNAEHLYALIHFFSQNKFNRVFLHIFTDGRDSPPTAALSYLEKLRQVIQKEGVGEIATIMGRYWAMDRDFRWERTKAAYLALTAGKGHLVKTPEEAIKISYEQGKTDEFIEPSIITDREGRPISLIRDNDAVIFFNFRVDRPRQLTKAFIAPDFSSAFFEWDFDPYLEKYKKRHTLDYYPPSPLKAFERNIFLKNLYFVTMTEYAKSFAKDGVKVAFPPEKVINPLGEVISSAGLLQLRMAESEKERFVTFYFNGLEEKPSRGEERIIIPSPKVPTYDQKPEMSAYELTDRAIKEISSRKFSFILINFANPDMVGHTGNLGPTVKACEVVDECIGKIANFCLSYGASLIITADHGNAEQKINPQTGGISTEHTNNPVPFIAISPEFLGKNVLLPSGILADVAPTVLSLLDLPKPKEMTGRNLLEGIK